MAPSALRHILELDANDGSVQSLNILTRIGITDKLVAIWHTHYVGRLCWEDCIVKTVWYIQYAIGKSGKRCQAPLLGPQMISLSAERSPRYPG